MDTTQLIYPVEFELRIVYKVEDNPNLVEDVTNILDVHQVSTKPHTSLNAKVSGYGRLICPVKFLDKESMYDIYNKISAIAGVKFVL